MASRERWAAFDENRSMSAPHKARLGPLEPSKGIVVNSIAMRVYTTARHTLHPFPLALASLALLALSACQSV